MGIEPTSEAWEASILPLYDARSLLLGDYTQPSSREKRLDRPSCSSLAARLSHSHRAKFEGVQTCFDGRVFLAESLNRRSIGHLQDGHAERSRRRHYWAVE
jgi:hypothetical protein